MTAWLIAAGLFAALAVLHVARMRRRAKRRAYAASLAAFIEQVFNPYADGTAVVPIHVPKGRGYTDLQVANIEFVAPNAKPRTVYVAGDPMCPHGNYDTEDCPHCVKEREERANGAEWNPDTDREPAPDLPDDIEGRSFANHGSE